MNCPDVAGLGYHVADIWYFLPAHSTSVELICLDTAIVSQG
jgi:hypothetical protein